MKTLWAFMTALPELIRLIKNIERRVAKVKEDKKVNEDLKAINEAFETKDAAKLNDIFNDGNS